MAQLGMVWLVGMVWLATTLFAGGVEGDYWVRFRAQYADLGCSERYYFEFRERCRVGMLPAVRRAVTTEYVVSFCSGAARAGVLQMETERAVQPPDTPCDLSTAAAFGARLATDELERLRQNRAFFGSESLSEVPSVPVASRRASASGQASRE